MNLCSGQGQDASLPLIVLDHIFVKDFDVRFDGPWAQ